MAEKRNTARRIARNVLGTFIGIGLLFGAKEGCDTHNYEQKHKNDPVEIFKTPQANVYKLVDVREYKPRDTITFIVANNANDSSQVILNEENFGQFTKTGIQITRYRELGRDNDVVVDYPVIFEAPKYVLK